MPYNITLSNGEDLIAGGLLDNTADSANTSLVLLGKNYKGYGLFLNQNFVRLMENFAKTTEPSAPIPGQLWFNSTTKLLSVNVAATKGSGNAIWKTLAGMTLSASTPTNSYTGEQWYDTTNGQLKIYTGTEWRLVGPLSRLATGNSGAIPDTVTDAPPSTTYVVIKFFIDNILVGIWSKDGPFASDTAGFATIKKGLNLNSTLGHTFWGNSEVAQSIYVNNVAVFGNTFVRNNMSGSINGSLSLTNDGGLTFGAASDFVANVTSGTVTLHNQTNNRDFILSLKTGGTQTPFLRGNYQTGLAEAYAQPTNSSPALTFATKNYVDILSGLVNGTANFFGHIIPSANVTFTLGNTTNRFKNIFSESILVGNVNAANTFVTVSNVATIYLGADLIPTANISSNVGSQGMRLNTMHANSVSLTGRLDVGLTASVGGNLTVSGNSSVAANLAVTGNLVVGSSRAAISTSTGALVVTGGIGLGGNLHVGGQIFTPTMPPGTSNTAVATTAFVQNNSVPTGSLMMWPTVSAPTGFLLCNGLAVSRTTYAALFAILGSTFGNGDGVNTFNLPDYRNRMPVGAGTLYEVGNTGGNKDAVVVSHAHTTSITQTPHKHTFPTRYDYTGGQHGFYSPYNGLGTNFNSDTSFENANISVTVNSVGESGTNKNLPPYLAINFIIKT